MNTSSSRETVPSNSEQSQPSTENEGAGAATPAQRKTDMSTRRTLSEILGAREKESLARAWETTEAAEKLVPIEPGIYEARLIGGELGESKHKKTRSYRLTFEITEEKYWRRRLWRDLWLTKTALGITKRELDKIGITRLAQLEEPVPQGIVCKIRVSLNRDESGSEWNEVRSFEFLRIDKPELDPFAPAEGDETNQTAQVSSPTDASSPVQEVEPDPTTVAPQSETAAYPPDWDEVFAVANEPRLNGVYAVDDAPRNGRKEARS